MIEVISSALLEFLVKVLTGSFLYLADPNFGYAYAVHVGWQYYQAYVRISQIRAIFKNEAVFKISKPNSSEDDKGEQS